MVSSKQLSPWTILIGIVISYSFKCILEPTIYINISIERNLYYKFKIYTLQLGQTLPQFMNVYVTSFLLAIPGIVSLIHKNPDVGTSFYIVFISTTIYQLLQVPELCLIKSSVHSSPLWANQFAIGTLYHVNRDYGTTKSYRLEFKT